MRKLAIVAFCFSAAVYASRYFLPYDWLPVSSAISVAVSFIAFIFKGKIRQRIFIAVLSIAVGFLWSWSYTHVFVKPFWDLHENIEPINAVITDYPVARQPRGCLVTG